MLKKTEILLLFILPARAYYFSMKRISIKDGTVVRMQRGITAECLGGCLWITWKNSGDVFLRPGERFRIPRGAVVQAIGDAVLGEVPVRQVPGRAIKNRRQEPAVDW